MNLTDIGFLYSTQLIIQKHLQVYKRQHIIEDISEIMIIYLHGIINFYNRPIIFGNFNKNFDIIINNFLYSDKYSIIFNYIIKNKIFY